MQNPEVWSFSEPQSQFKVHEFDASGATIKDIQHFYFNHLVCVVIPDCLRIPDQLDNLLSDDCAYYKVLDVKLSDLLKPAFISNFIKKGKLALLSIGTRIDCDNCCAVTPTGILVLSLTKDTYQTLGLEGKLSHFTQRIKDRYNPDFSLTPSKQRYLYRPLSPSLWIQVVKLDLSSPKLIPGKPYYEKTHAALKSLESFTVIVSWEPPEDSICPSSIAKFFDEINCQVLSCEPNFSSHVVYSVKTPTLEGANIDENDVVDFIEWLGMVLIDGEFTGNAQDYANTYEPPEPNAELGPIRVLVWRGFYQPNKIAMLIDFVKKFNSQDKIWTSMYVQGFSDSPVMENCLEQNYFTNGDNGNIFIFKNPKSWYCKHRRSAKRYK